MSIYDVHGWLTGVVNGEFQERLYYADGLDGGCWNGNISTMKWDIHGDCLRKALCQRVLFLEIKKMVKERIKLASWDMEIIEPFNSMRLNMVLKNY